MHGSGAQVANLRRFQGFPRFCGSGGDLEIPVGFVLEVGRVA